MPGAVISPHPASFGAQSDAPRHPGSTAARFALPGLAVYQPDLPWSGVRAGIPTL